MQPPLPSQQLATHAMRPASPSPATSSSTTLPASLWQLWQQRSGCASVEDVSRCVQELQQHSPQCSPQAQQLLQGLLPFVQALAEQAGAGQEQQLIQQDLQLLQKTFSDIFGLGGFEAFDWSDLPQAIRHIKSHAHLFHQQFSALENREKAMDSHAIVSTADVHGNIIYANDLFCKINGMAREDLIGKNHRIVSSGMHSPDFFSAMWATITSGEVWHGEICNRTPKGKIYWVAATIMPFMDDDGLPHKYISVRTEITAQKNLEMQIAQERLFLENVMNGLNEGIIVINASGHCVFMNPVAEKMLDWSYMEVGHLPFKEVMCLSCEGGEDKSGSLRQYMCERQPVHLNENHNAYLTNRFGKVIPVEAVFSPLVDEGSNEVSYIITLRDITARKEYQAAIVQAKEAAEAASQARTSFLANMSHEIRTPMNAIIGFSEALLDSPLDSAQRRQLTTVRQAGHSLLRLLNEVLDMAKLEKGAVVLEVADFSLRQLCDLVMDTQRLGATKKGLAMVLDYPEELPDFFQGDALRLQQILLNLLSNAVKFTSAGAVTLRISCPAAGGVALYVEDTGIGMDSEQLARIFDPFAQADASTTRRFGGTGLGTTIARQLVELMGGEITVSTVQGQGSAFCVSLPLPLGQAVGQVTEELLQLPPLSILAVDDMPDNLELLQLVLQRQGHRVSTASNGLQAVEQCQEQDFDLVLMDLHMPELDGFAAAIQIHTHEQQAQRRATPIIALSASVLEEDRLGALGAGMQGFAHKPIHLPTLLAEMQRVLGLPALAQRPPASVPTSTSAPASALTPPSPSTGLWDEQAAIALWGSTENWQRALQRCMAQNQDVVPRLQQMRQAADWQSLSYLAHGLRGVSANLQLHQLPTILQRLEQAGRDTDAEAVEAQLTLFCQAWQLLQQALATQPLEASTPKGPEQAQEQAVQQCLENLNPTEQSAARAALARLMAELNCGALPSEGLLATLPQWLPPSCCQCLQEALEQFDFASALQQIQDLQSRLG